MELIGVIIGIILLVMLFVRLGEISAHSKQTSDYLMLLTKKELGEIDITDWAEWKMRKYVKMGLITGDQVKVEKERRKGEKRK